MLPSKEIIRKNSMIICELLSKMRKCSFSEIQSICKLDSICICLSLIDLVRLEKILQINTPDGVVYMLANK